MRLLSVVFVCAVALTLTACSGTVEGKVTNKSSGQPVQGAVVKVGTKTATTAADGTYAITGIPTGSRAARATCQGFAGAAAQVQVKRGTTSLDMTLQDGSLTVLVRENAVFPEPVQNAVVTLDGSRMTPSTTNSFAASDVLLGDHKVVITAPNHEVFAATVHLHVGSNAEDAGLSLTAVETCRRQFETVLFYNYRQAYAFLDPLVRKRYPYHEYAAAMEFGGNVFVSEQIYGSHVVPESTLQFVKGTFHNLTAVDCAVREQDATGANFTLHQTSMWQEIKGRWYVIF
jgi:hypothetical protein